MVLLIRYGDRRGNFSLEYKDFTTKALGEYPLFFSVFFFNNKI